MQQRYFDKFNQYLKEETLHNQIYPNTFINIMNRHKPMINVIEIDNINYIDLRNPLIVVLGDSVSAGFFEQDFFDQRKTIQSINDSYIEKFKYLLHEKYPISLPSVINSALAGDNIKNMYKRIDRDVISHQPDLVIINATLNWSNNRGTLVEYEYFYTKIIQEIKEKTLADIILMTPNLAVEKDEDQTLECRVNIVRKVAEAYRVSLVDIYKMWTDVIEHNDDLKSLLSNQENHPTPVGHTFMAKALMQVFK